MKEQKLDNGAKGDKKEQGTQKHWNLSLGHGEIVADAKL